MRSQSKQGNLGVAAAILYFTKSDYIVSKPLYDTQRYDLVVDKGGLFRVECKTTKAHCVELRTYYPHTNNSVKVSSDDMDLLFVYHLDGRMYLFPSKFISGRRGVSLGPKADKWRVTQGA